MKYKEKEFAGEGLARGQYGEWRPRPESNRGARICSPLRNHSATRPQRLKRFKRLIRLRSNGRQAAKAHSRSFPCFILLDCWRQRQRLALRSRHSGRFIWQGGYANNVHLAAKWRKYAAGTFEFYDWTNMNRALHTL